jgi:hypothetical protein
MQTAAMMKSGVRPVYPLSIRKLCDDHEQMAPHLNMDPLRNHAVTACEELCRTAPCLDVQLFAKTTTAHGLRPLFTDYRLC